MIRKSLCSRTKLLTPRLTPLNQVKTKNKAHKDFGHLFLAQELFIPHPVSPSEAQASVTQERAQEEAESEQSSDDESSHSQAAPTTPKTKQGQAPPRGKKKNAVWSIKFSDDGRYLAVGGKDGVVRGEFSIQRET